MFCALWCSLDSPVYNIPILKEKYLARNSIQHSQPSRNVTCIKSLGSEGLHGLPLLTLSIVLFFISVTTTAVWTTQNSHGAGGIDPQWWKDLQISGPGTQRRPT